MKLRLIFIKKMILKLLCEELKFVEFLIQLMKLKQEVNLLSAKITNLIFIFVRSDAGVHGLQIQMIYPTKNIQKLNLIP